MCAFWRRERYGGKPFAISNVHRVLTSEAHLGCHRFNTRDIRTGQDKPASDLVHVRVPAIIDDDILERVCARLSAEMTGMLHDGPPVLRRAHPRLFVDHVSVAPDQIRVSGPTAVLARAATAPDPAPVDVPALS